MQIRGRDIQIVDVVQKIEQDLQDGISRARRYAHVNVGVQLIPGVVIVIINILANSQQPSQTTSDDSSSNLSPLQWANLFLVGGLIITQYFTHSFYIATNLRRESDEIKAVHKCLKEAQEHLLFRAIEFNAFYRCKHDLEVTRDTAILIVETAKNIERKILQSGLQVDTGEMLSSLITVSMQQNSVGPELSQRVNEYFLSLMRENGGQLTKEMLASVSVRQDSVVKETNAELARLDNVKPQRTEELSDFFEQGSRLVQQP